MSASNSVVLPIPTFLAGVDVHWETQRRMEWNVREHTSEERELVYDNQLDPRPWALAQFSAVAAQGEKLKHHPFANAVLYRKRIVSKSADARLRSI